MGVSPGRPVTLMFRTYLQQPGIEDISKTYLAGSRVDTRQVHFRLELNGWWFIWIGSSTVNVDTVDPILMYALFHRDQAKDRKSWR